MHVGLNTIQAPTGGYDAVLSMFPYSFWMVTALCPLHLLGGPLVSLKNSLFRGTDSFSKDHVQALWLCKPLFICKTNNNATCCTWRMPTFRTTVYFVQPLVQRLPTQKASHLPILRCFGWSLRSTCKHAPNEVGRIVLHRHSNRSSNSSSSRKRAAAAAAASACQHPSSLRGPRMRASCLWNWYPGGMCWDGRVQVRPLHICSGGCIARGRQRVMWYRWAPGRSVCGMHLLLQLVGGRAGGRPEGTITVILWSLLGAAWDEQGETSEVLGCLEAPDGREVGLKAGGRALCLQITINQHT